MKVSSGKSSKSKTSKAKGSKPKSGGKFPSASQLSGEYKADARRAQASARRETADAQHRTKEAQHYEQEAAKAKKEGYSAEAKYDLAKARKEMAEARRDQAKATRNQVKSKLDKVKAARAKAGLLSPGAIGGGWILGGNDWHNGCAAVALANHLYAATGIRASDRDILDLYWLMADDPGEGASVAATLEVAAEYGLGGMRPMRYESPGRFRYATSPGQGSPGCSRPDLHCNPLIVELDLTEAQRHQPVWDWEPSPDWGAHAGLLASDRVITWGRAVPVTAEFLARQAVAAWQIEWGVSGD